MTSTRKDNKVSFPERVEPTEKTCCYCGIEKSIDCFNSHNHDNDDRVSIHYDNYCTSCYDKKRCSSCHVVKLKNKFKYDYDSCTACYALKMTNKTRIRPIQPKVITKRMF